MDGHFPFFIPDEDAGRLGLELQELLDGIGGPALGPGFQIAADQVEGHDGRRHLHEGGAGEPKGRKTH